MTELAKTILVGALGSLLGALVLWLVLQTRLAVRVLGSSQRLAVRLRKSGMSAFHISRDDYPSTLRSYLSTASHSIGIVSISLKVTDDEGGLIDLFRQRIAQSADFRVTVSLLNPLSPSTVLVARSLNVAEDTLREEIRSMLRRLIDLRDSLPEIQRERCRIRVHDPLPIGSGILLDATPERGRVQVETKLYRSPRTESFGYEITGPSEFYTRHYRSYSQILDESEPAGAHHLGGVG